MGRTLVAVGMALVVIGVLMAAAERGMGGWRLPGDFQFGGRGWRVYFPLASGLLFSVVLTIVANLFLWLIRRR